MGRTRWLILAFLLLSPMPVAVMGLLAYGTGRWGGEHGGIVVGLGLGLSILMAVLGWFLLRPPAGLAGLPSLPLTGRGKTELALSRANRALRVLRACNEVLVRTTEEKRLLDEVCRILVELGGYRLAWVGEALEDEEKTVRPLAWAGCEEGYLRAVRISWGENEWGSGPTGRAVRSGEPVICRDIPNDPLYAPWREEALQRGYRSSIALPLRSGGRVLGALNLYAAEVRAFDLEEVQFLMHLADDLAYGLAALRARAADQEVRARAEQQERLAVMGQIVAGVAHDFANILQGILSFAELLDRKEDLPEEARGPLHFICQMAERGAQITRQILDFSRQSAAEKRPLKLGPFMQEMVALLRRTIPESIRVTLECPPDLPVINADAGRLQQILLNLATNARDAMPEGGQLTLRLSALTVGSEAHPLYRDLPAGHWVRLEVADTGCGIPPEVLPHIFEPFFTTKERGFGTGLGLSQVYGLVKQHDGFIYVRTELGKGTSFDLLFPALVEEERADEKEGKAGPAVGGRTVLLVEDEPAVRRALQEMLMGMGYRVLVASSGPEALGLYGQHRSEIAVVLTDAVMPWMDSATLIRTLQERDAGVKVVVISGYPPGEGNQPQKVAAWLSKPVSRAQLEQTLRQVLGS